MADLTLRQRFWRSRMAWTLVALTTFMIPAIGVAWRLGRVPTPLAAVQVALIGLLWIAGAWLVRRARVWVTEDAVEIREPAGGTQTISRAAARTIDAHPGDHRFGIYWGVDRRGWLPGWSRADLDRIAAALRARICDGTGLDCPSARSPGSVPRAELVLRQGFWRSLSTEMLVLVTVVGAVTVAVSERSWETIAIGLALGAVLWIYRWLDSRASRITVTAVEIEARSLLGGVQRVPRPAITAIDAHNDTQGLYSLRTRVITLRPSWPRRDLEQLGQTLGVTVCVGRGPNCPSTRTQDPTDR